MPPHSVNSAFMKLRVSLSKANPLSRNKSGDFPCHQMLNTHETAGTAFLTVYLALEEE